MLKSGRKNKLNNKVENLEVNTSLKLLVKTSFVVLLGMFLSKVLGYAYRILIARNFGPEVYGSFSLAIVILSWAVALVSLGFTEGVLRYVSLYRGKYEFSKIRYILKFSLSLLLFTSIFGGVLLFLLSTHISQTFFHTNSLIFYLKIFAILLPIFVISNIFLSIIRAFEFIGWYSFILNIFQNIIKVAAILLLIYAGLREKSIAVSYFIGVLSILFLSFYVLKFKISALLGKVALSKDSKFKIRHELFSYSWPILFFSMITSLFYWVDSILLGYFKDISRVGFYNAAIPIAMLLLIIPEVFMQLFFPLITKEYSKNNFKLISELSKQVSKWIFALNLPIFFLMVLFPGVFINLLFGAEYLAAENALRFLAIGAFISSISVVSNNLLSMLGKSRIILYDTLASLIITIILNILIIPRYGLNGAAFATMLGFMLLNSLFLFQAICYSKIIPLRKKMVNILFSALGSFFVLFLLKNLAPSSILYLGLIAAIFLSLYILLLLLTGCLDREDMLIISAIKKKIFSKI